MAEVLEISAKQVRLLRLRGQILHPRQSDVVQVVKDVCGIQAQEVEAGMISIGVRGEGITIDDLTRAWVEERNIVRTWMMRGTLHFVTKEDFAWMQPLFGPLFIRGNQKRRLDLGVSDDTAERGVHLLRDLLGDRGPLTKAEIVEVLSAKGIPMEGQASIHLIGLAAAQGWVCYGPPRGKKDTFVLIEDWLGKIDGEEKGIDELAHRYLTAFAPATVEDFASWSGLPLWDCRAAWKKMALVETQIDNKNYWMLESQLDWLKGVEDHPSIVRLLPRYDTYLLGYADRSLIIEPEHVKKIYPGGGMIHPAVLVDGKVVGKWTRIRQKPADEINVEAFEAYSDAVKEALEAERGESFLFAKTLWG